MTFTTLVLNLSTTPWLLTNVHKNTRNFPVKFNKQKKNLYDMVSSSILSIFKKIDPLFFHCLHHPTLTTNTTDNQHQRRKNPDWRNLCIQIIVSSHVSTVRKPCYDKWQSFASIISKYIPKASWKVINKVGDNECPFSSIWYLGYKPHFRSKQEYIVFEKHY